MRKLIFAIIAALSLGCTQKGEPSIYLLPKDFTGYIIILYNYETGQQKTYIDSRRVYSIPKSGVLKTQFSPDYGRTELPKFYYEHVSKENEIPVIVDWTEFNEDKVNATLPSIGKAYKNLDGSEKIDYAKIFIGTKSQIEQYSKEVDRIDISTLDAE